MENSSGSVRCVKMCQMMYLLSGILNRQYLSSAVAVAAVELAPAVMHFCKVLNSYCTHRRHT